MEMDKNLLLAIALSVGVYALWFGVVEKRMTPPETQTSALGSQTSASDISPESSAAPQEQNSQTSGTPAASLASGAARQKTFVSRPVQFGEKAQMRVDALGAGIVSYEFLDRLGAVELVPDAMQPPGFLATWPQTAFRAQGADSMSYAAELPGGAKITKTFVPGTAQSLPRLQIELSNPTSQPVQVSAWTISLGPGLNTIESEQKDNQKVWRALALARPQPGLEGRLEVFKKPATEAENFQWVGIDNRYFLAAMLPPPELFTSVSAQTPPQVTLDAPASMLAPHADAIYEIPFYIGPKGMIWLSHFHLGLERSISFGFFSSLGRVMMSVLYWLNRFTRNWGWSIIVLTILIQLLLLPLSYKGFKSMSAMKKLQPEIARIQQIYAKDAKKLNEEMMGVYKKHGVHPASGCLPMFVQFPVFFALYYALRGAWELHGAGWIFWITDLSARDPYFVLPLVMGGVMFAQNKLNPMSTDPTQAQMMTWMPIIFTFMFLYFPSGLVLYYLTSNLCTLLMQTAFRRRLEARA